MEQCQIKLNNFDRLIYNSLFRAGRPGVKCMLDMFGVRNVWVDSLKPRLVNLVITVKPPVMPPIIYVHYCGHFVYHPPTDFRITHSNSAVRTRVITNYVFSHASVHITKRALTIPLFHRPILYGKSLNGHLTLSSRMIEFEFEYLF